MGFKSGKIIRHEGFEPLALNEGNVDAIFNRCLATPDYKGMGTFAQVLVKDLTGKVSDRKMFMKDAILANSKTISYLFGQLKSVHNQDSHILLDYGVLTYEGRKWTSDIDMLFKLYELGIANAIILPFSSQRTNADMLLSRLRDDVKPTLSPKDPNFPAWWEAHKAEWEEKEHEKLFRDGVTAYKAEDYTKALSMFEKAAEHVNENAYYWCGEACFFGDDSLNYPEKALTWYEKAAKVGNKDAEKRIAELQQIIAIIKKVQTEQTGTDKEQQIVRAHFNSLALLEGIAKLVKEEDKQLARSMAQKTRQIMLDMVAE